MVNDPDETRTRNLLIRSQTPYPLGHGTSDGIVANIAFKPTKFPFQRCKQPACVKQEQENAYIYRSHTLDETFNYGVSSVYLKRTSCNVVVIMHKTKK